MKSPGQTSGRFSLLQFNMWGWLGHHGDDRLGHWTAGVIRELRPSVVTLNEVCLGQLQAMVRDLRSWGLEYQFHHDFILHREDKEGSCDFGNALLWPGRRPEAREPEKFLSTPPGEQPRKILAVKVDWLKLPTVLCVTHLTSGGKKTLREAREQQVKEIAGYISAWKDRGFEVLLGGDFNEQPDSPRLDPMYLPVYGRGSRGICHEAACAEAHDRQIRRKPFIPTHVAGLKYDYIFMTTAYRPAGVTCMPAQSDHHVYVGLIA